MADFATLKERVGGLPTRPGVYIFKDNDGRILYVGKALNLRNRVRSYFQLSGRTAKTVLLMGHVAELETIVTDSEVEALILESTLIKEHRPHYNVRLKDDKQYPYIRIGLHEPWPRPEIRRKVASDGARYFGPYTDVRSVRRTLDLLNRMFPFATCNMRERRGQRACLKHHIGRCLGPCVEACGRDEYMEVVERVCLFLEGKTEKVVSAIRQQMEQASEELRFERAGFLRDQIHAIERTVERQKVISTTYTDQDVIAFARDDGDACVEVFFVRQGKLVGHEHFMLEGVHDENEHEIIESFVSQFYQRATYVPEEIVVPVVGAELATIEAWLRRKRGDQVRLLVPRHPEEQRLLELVATNAAEELEQMRLRWLADRRKLALAVTELSDALGLDNPPRRIECYDISNTQGTNAVGSMVVFEDGKAKKSDYRRFRIKTVEGANDFAMLQETLRRRFKRALDSRQAEQANEADFRSAWSQLPQLIIVDGGKGQLSAALAVRDQLGLQEVPIIGLAKEREEVFLPGESEPVLLPPESQGLYLVQRIRDEAHRFAINYHRRLRSNSQTRSVLDEIPGIGERRKAMLLRRFGTMAAIREAPLEELSVVRGMTPALARKLKTYL